MYIDDIGIIGFGSNIINEYMNEYKSNTNQWKREIHDEFMASKKLSRKKKKQRRKELQLDWNLACWDPLAY